METVRPCGCKGIRSCLRCEEEYKISKPHLKAQLQKHRSYVYCPQCDKCWPGWDMNLYKSHPNHQGNPIKFPGVYIKLQFLSDEERSMLMKSLDNLPWEVSQSGRRKQNFGPKCNFRKKKLRLGNFHGFPRSTRFVQEKFSTVEIMDGFKTVEQCSLEYEPSRGASIDPHIDDCWIWGERIVTVNVSGDSALTMTPFKGCMTKYNLVDMAGYCGRMYKELFGEKDGKLNGNMAAELSNNLGQTLEERFDENVKEKLDEKGVALAGRLEDTLGQNVKEKTEESLGQGVKKKMDEKEEEIVVRLPMPEGSLMVLYGAARYAWEHSVLREDIESRRVCLAYREFTTPYLNGSLDVDVVQEIFKKAAIFN